MGVITLIMTEEKWVYKGNGEANHLSIKEYLYESTFIS